MKETNDSRTLEKLEIQIGRKIPIVKNINGNKIGAVFNNQGKIIKLGLCNYKLKSLPDLLGDFSFLQELNLYNNKLTTLPNSIGKMKSLKLLTLDTNNLSTLPETFGNLKSLEILWLSHNDFSRLPEVIGNLKNLKFLYLNDNPLKEIPESMLKLENLKRIHLHHVSRLNSNSQIVYDKLWDIIEEKRMEIKNLGKEEENEQILTKQDMQLTSEINTKQDVQLTSEINTKQDMQLTSEINNFLQWIKDPLGLQGFIEYYLQENNINIISQLSEIYGRLNYICTIKSNADIKESEENILEQAEFEFLMELEELIGASIPQMKEIDRNTFGVKIECNNIIHLGLYHCNLSIIPDSISKLTSLQVLYLGKNQINKFPLQLLNLKFLEKLDLSYNLIEEIPDSIKKLKNLEELYLEFNRLIKLPDSIRELEKLRYLGLSYNRLNSLPSSIIQMVLWTYRNFAIKLDGNPWKGEWKKYYLGIKYRIEPKQALALEKLKELLIKSTSKCEIYPQFAYDTEGKNVTKLLINYYDLSTLPESIGNLVALQELNLEHNNFITIPPFIWPLKNLKKLYMWYNPLNDESKCLLKRDINSILEYCRERASIKIFLSYKMEEFKVLNIKQLSKYLEQKNEVYKTYYCDRDTVEDIYEFMEQAILKSHLLLFFASEKSLEDSEHCVYELKLAKVNNLRIIPIITESNKIDWNKLTLFSNKINLGLDLGNQVGFSYDAGNYKVFCDTIYDYIKKFKRNINLFERDNDSNIEFRQKRDLDYLNLNGESFPKASLEKYEKKMGKHAIWRGKFTKGFKNWFTDNYS